MSYNGSGVFVINSTGQPVSANTLIEASVFNAFTADVATGLSTCLAKDGQSTVTANLPMAGYRLTGLGAGSAAGNSLRYEQLFSTSAVTLLGAMNWVKGADIASDATINLTTATGNAGHITGTTTITAVALASGMWRLVIFDGALTLTHSATANNLPGGANITTAANDRALYWSDGTVVYCAAYNRASGKAIVAPAVGEVTGYGTGVATALAVNVGSAGAPVVFDGALGTPSSGNLANCTGYPATSGITLATPQASTSGSAITFSSIPAGTKRITLMLDGVSTNGTSVPLIQLGDSGGLETTGYNASVMFVYASAADAAESTSGFLLREGWSAAQIVYGSIVFTHIGSNAWAAQGSCKINTGATAAGIVIGGTKTLTAELDRIAVVTSDTFDAGTINIMYET